MKIKILFLIILMVGFASARSQQWAPVGAFWVYDVSQGSPLILTYIKSEKDTVVAGKECRLLAIRNISRMMNPNGTYYLDTSLISKECIYNSNDTVYHYDRSLKVFYPLYLMNVQKNDTVLVRPGNPDCSDNSCVRFEYVVDSLTSCKLNDQELKVIYNAATNKSEWVFNRSGINENYPVIERIGSVKYFFGVSKIVIMEGTVLQLRCYTDNNISYKDAAFKGDCSSLLQSSLSGTKTSKLVIDKMIYPNPFNDYFNIPADEPVIRATIFDMNGQNVLEINSISPSGKVSATNLNSGAYLLKLNYKNGDQKILKIFKL